MIANLVICGFMIGLFCMLFVTPSFMYRGVVQLDCDELTSSDKIKSWIPIYNTIHAEHEYTGGFSFVLASNIFFVLAMGFRLLVVFVIYQFSILQLISWALMMISFLTLYIANVRIVFIILKDADVCSIVKTVLYAILFPVGQYYIGSFLQTVMKNVEKEEKTFKW